MTELAFRRLDPDAILPERAHPGDAGFDLRSIEDLEIGHGHDYQLGHPVPPSELDALVPV